MTFFEVALNLVNAEEYYNNYPHEAGARNDLDFQWDTVAELDDLLLKYRKALEEIATSDSRFRADYLRIAREALK